MPQHQHKSNTKSVQSIKSSRSASVSGLSKPERKEIRKSHARSGKHIKNQHEIIIASYITDAKIMHVKPTITAEEKAMKMVKRESWELRKPSMRQRRSIEAKRDCLAKQDCLSKDKPILIGDDDDDAVQQVYDGMRWSTARLNPLFADPFDSLETKVFRKFAKTYDPIASHMSFSDFMRQHFPTHFDNFLLHRDDEEDWYIED
jgi:hypothetical protein